MSRAVTKRYIRKNGTNLGRGIGSIECQLFREDNKGSVAIPNDNYGHFHTCCKNGKTFGGPRGKCHILVSLMVEGYRVKGEKF